MSRWLSARAKAYQVRKAIEAKHGAELYGEALIAAIVADQDLMCLEVPASDSLLADQDGNSQARYYTEEQYIVVQADLHSAIRNLLKAHELGHHFVHTRQAVYSIEAIDPTALVLTLPYAEGRIATYNSRQMQEHEATVFACELLIPSERLAARFDRGHTVAELVAVFQTLESILFAQMATVLLAPLPNYEELLRQTELPPFHWTDLDDSQKAACCAPMGPVLVQAGPGTGKTRTLTSRIEWLIMEKEVPPEQILVLTFSNKATDELRLRLRRTVPTVAHQVTVTTFHGYGLELLRRYTEKVGLPLDFRVLDPLEAEMVLEAHLRELDLSHFSDPTNPDRFLGEMVEAISKVKEELIDVPTCEQLLHELTAHGPDKIAPEIIEQYLEVGRVYQRYETILQQGGLVDYGDLVLKPVLLLRNASEVLQQLQAQYTHVLVDEYQDINRANGELVRLLVGKSGVGLWVVGDLRQSIYRWRGATPEYLARFRKQFPHADEYFLDINYRSSESLVNLVSHFAAKMDLPVPARPWKANRGVLVPSSIKSVVADDKQAELRGIGETINAFVREGAHYADIAILCRTNGQTREIAAALSSFEIPVLHLGQFFFRSEVKDLLSVLALIGDGDSATWIRVAALLRQPLSIEVASDLWRRINMSDTPFPDALRTILDDANLSPLQRLDLSYFAAFVERHLRKEIINPWRVLCEFLFDYGHYLRQLRTGNPPDKQQILLAIAQLLNLANAFRQHKSIGAENQPIRTMLNYVRRATKRDDNDIDLPISELDIDAVRVLTIHKAKGLEFPIVFVPNLAKGRFPARTHSNTTLPRLDQLMRRDVSDEAALEEESCLFVALSRARDHLILSRAASYSQRLGKPTKADLSMLWRLLDPALTALGMSVQTITWPRHLHADYEDRDREVEDGKLRQDEAIHLDFQAVRVYQRCPRQYYYRYGLGLAIRDEREIYRQFYRLIYQISDWLGAELAHDRLLEWPSIVERIERGFQENLPPNHIHAAWYRQQAERLIRRLWERYVVQSQLPGIRSYQITARVELEGAIVMFPIDELVETEEKLFINLFRMGRVAKSHLEESWPALCRKYAQSYSERPVQIQFHYLATNEVQTVPADKYEKILRGVSEDISRIRRRDFPSLPTDNRVELVCGSCSFFFLCPGPSRIS